MPARSPLADVPPDRFVEARNELVRKLREGGKAEEARRVAALRRPSLALFIANQLAKRDGKSVDALIDASHRAQRAQMKGGSGDALREAMGQQREALRSLLAQADEAAKEIGTALTPELRRRIQDTLQTAATAEPEALREGALEHELSAAGFGAVLSGPQAAAAHAVTAAGRAGANARHAAVAAAHKASEVAARAETHKRALNDKAQERKRQMAERRERLLRQRELAQVEQVARRQGARAHQMEQQARQLEQRAEQARRAADRARAEAEEARRNAEEAEARAAELRREDPS